MEQLRIMIVDLLDNSGLTLEQELFIIRDIYKDINYTIEKKLKEVEKDGTAKDLQSN